MGRAKSEFAVLHASYVLLPVQELSAWGAGGPDPAPIGQANLGMTSSTSRASTAPRSSTPSTPAAPLWCRSTVRCGPGSPQDRRGKLRPRCRSSSNALEPLPRLLQARQPSWRVSPTIVNPSSGWRSSRRRRARVARCRGPGGSRSAVKSLRLHGLARDHRGSGACCPRDTNGNDEGRVTTGPATRSFSLRGSP